MKRKRTRKCKDCHRPETEARISKRGLCPECAKKRMAVNMDMMIEALDEGKHPEFMWEVESRFRQGLYGAGLPGVPPSITMFRALRGRNDLPFALPSSTPVPPPVPDERDTIEDPVVVAKSLNLFEGESGMAIIDGEGNEIIWDIQGLVGLRHWKIDSGGVLRSPLQETLWETSIRFADCKPSVDSRKGIYATYLSGPPPCAPDCVDGLVELRGDIVEHRDGTLRAEWAKMLALFVSVKRDSVEEDEIAIRDKYQVPVIRANSQVLSVWFMYNGAKIIEHNRRVMESRELDTTSIVQQVEDLLKGGDNDN